MLRRLVPESITLVQGRLDGASGRARIDRAAKRITITIDARAGGMNERTVMHEFVHAAVLARYDLLSNAGAKSRRVLGVAYSANPQIDALMKLWGDFARHVKRAFKDADAPTWVAEAAASPDEFMTYALTHQRFQQYLAGLRMDKSPRSAWQRFVAAIRRMLGIEGNASWLDAALRASEDVLVAAERDAADFATSGKVSDEALNARLHAELNEVAADPSLLMDDGRQRSMAVPEIELARGLRQRIADIFADTKSSGALMGVMTLRQIGDMFGHVPAVKKFVEASSKMAERAKKLQSEAWAVDVGWRQLPDAALKAMHELMLDASMARVRVDVSAEHVDNKHLDGAGKARQAELAERFEALPERAQQVYVEARDKNRSDRAEIRRQIDATVVRSYEPVLGAQAEELAKATNRAERVAAMASLRSKVMRKEARAMWAALDENATRFKSLPGDYFALVRYGPHVVVLRSDALQAAQAELTSAREAQQAAMAAVDEEATPDQKKVIDAARKRVTELAKKVDAMKSDDSQYRVEFFERKSEADRRAAQLTKWAEDNGHEGLRVSQATKADYFRQLDSASPAFMSRLETAIKENLPAKDASAVESAMRELMLSSLPEMSALKHSMKRMNVAGVRASQMRRAFATAALRNANYISRLEYAGDMQAALAELRTAGDHQSARLGNELGARYAMSLQPENPSSVLNAIGSASYVTYLGMSPSFLLMNLAQPWVISVPVMAARNGVGMGRAAAEMGRATKEVMAAMRASYKAEKSRAGGTLGAARFELDMGLFKNKAERAMLDELFNKGLIDITFEREVGAISEGRAETLWGKTVELASLPAHHTEVVNRVATALAAYRIEASKGGTPEEAAAYAERIVHETHLDYSTENAPRLFNKYGQIGRLVLQFKKYGQGMLYLNVKNLMGAVRGDREAARTLGYLTGFQIAVAGLSGVPFAWVGGWIAAAVAAVMQADDEDLDFALMFQNALEDAFGENIANAARLGLPAAVGINVSPRIGASDLGNPLAFAQEGLKGREWWNAAIVGLAGPAASMLGNYAEAAAIAMDDPAKAAGTALPKVIADGFKAFDMATGGLKTRSGNVIIKPEDIKASHIMARAFGFQPTDFSNMYARRVGFTQATEAVTSARGKIVRDYIRTQVEGGDLTDILRRRAEFNQRHPKQAITYSTIAKSKQAMKRYEKSLRRGVPIRASEEDTARKLGLIP